MSEARRNLILGWIVIIGGGFLFWNTFYFPASIKADAPGPAFFPRIVLIIILFLGVFLVSSNFFSKKGDKPSAKALFNHRRVLIVSGAVAVYLILLPFLGFILDSFLYISLSLLGRITGTIKIIAIAAVSSACLYFIFAWLLNVRLP